MVPGDYPLHEFYGVIGTRPSFGAGKLYPDFSAKWKVKGYDQVSVSVSMSALWVPFVIHVYQLNEPKMQKL